MKKEKPFECEICNTGFSRKPQLNAHISSVHEGIKPFKCKICDASFSQKGDLNKHVSSVHGESNLSNAKFVMLALH